MFTVTPLPPSGLRHLTHTTILAAALLIAAPWSAAAADLGSRTATQWSPWIEWTLTNPSWDGNPFDVVATVEFTHRAGGSTHRTEMFFTGGTNTTWAFRFTGTQPGLWSFVTSSQDRDLDGHRGEVDVRPNPRPDAHGFLKSFEGKWGWEGTGSVFVPQLVMWDYIAGSGSAQLLHGNPSGIDQLIRRFIVDHGFSGFHVAVIAGRWFDFDADDDRVRTEMKDPDARTFEALELLISRTHQAGGMVHIWTWGDHQRLQTARSLEGGLGGPVDRRLQRYIASRLGPVPGWSMGYGFDLDEWVKAPQVRAWRDFMHARMGWHHFFGGRPEGPNHGLDHTTDTAWNQGLDYSSYEHHRPTYDVYLAAVQATPGVPVMSEDRFRIREGKYPEKDYTEELLRRGLYHSTLAGGVANIWGIDPDLSPGGLFPHRDWIKTWSAFFHDRGRFLADMKPAPEIGADPATRTLASRRTGSLVLYAESAKGFEVNFAGLPGPQPAIAVDTRRAYAEIDLGQVGPETRSIQLPHASDWAVAVGRFREPPLRSEAAGPAKLSFTGIWKGPDLNGGHGAMWADVDDDGLPDLYLPLIMTGTLPDLFMHNLGAGNFAEEGARRGVADPDGGSHGAAWCDLDNDGDYDLINGTTFDDGTGIHNNVFRNDSRGFFTEVKPAALQARAEATRAFISFDLDNDGDLDLFGVSNYQGSDDPPEERNEVYRNDGGFAFTSITAGELEKAPVGQGATDTDYDGDGDVDVLAANRTGPVNILQNDGRGNFRRVDPSSIGIKHRAQDGVTTADIDNDGDLDLLLGSGGGDGHLYRNTGRGAFTHLRSFPDAAGYMGAFADLDNDGDLDLYFAGDTRVFLNDGTGGFTPGPAVPVEGRDDPRGIAFADLDNDGDTDFAFGDKRARRNYILRNELTNGGNWLKVRLLTPAGQAGAFGAKTRIYPAGRAGTMPLGVRESQSNCGYLGQNDPVLHFGLASHTHVDLIVKFLDGTEVTQSHVAANQTVLIRAHP